jgi:hypothetical protein
MGAAIRERPRIVVAQAVGVILLLAVGFGLGSALKSDPEPKTPAAVQRQLDELKQDKRTAQAALDRAERTQARQARANRALRRRARADQARISRFRRALARARRGG